MNATAARQDEEIDSRLFDRLALLEDHATALLCRNNELHAMLEAERDKHMRLLPRCQEKLLYLQKQQADHATPSYGSSRGGLLGASGCGSDEYSGIDSTSHNLQGRTDGSHCQNCGSLVIGSTRKYARRKTSTSNHRKSAAKEDTSPAPSSTRRRPNRRADEIHRHPADQHGAEFQHYSDQRSCELESRPARELSHHFAARAKRSRQRQAADLLANFDQAGDEWDQDLTGALLYDSNLYWSNDDSDQDLTGALSRYSNQEDSL